MPVRQRMPRFGLRSSLLVSTFLFAALPVGCGSDEAAPPAAGKGGGAGRAGAAGSTSGGANGGGASGATGTSGTGGHQHGAGAAGSSAGGHEHGGTSGAAGQASAGSAGSGGTGGAGVAGHDHGTAGSAGASGAAGKGGASGGAGGACSDAPPGKPTGSTGENIGGCVQGQDVGNGKIKQCIAFPSGVRVKELRPVVDSFGTADPPCGTTFADSYSPLPGECSVRQHDRYWVRANDGHVYRTWHPPADVDVETGKTCIYGHEHGDDPRTSPLYQWAGGVPFGITNHAADNGAAQHHRHEDHPGHKVVVQNDWEAVLGNPPDDAAIQLAGFRCYWLSKVHQGTHSGDSFSMNEHEYENNMMCDDGAARNPDPGREEGAGKNDHTESSVKTLTTWGRPNELHPCGSQVGVAHPGGSNGREPPAGSDTKREIQCAKDTPGWLYKPMPVPIVGETGETDYPRVADGSSGGIGEIWKPWMTVVTRTGQTVFTSSAYYGVHNPARLYNPDGSVVAQRDMNGDGKVDDWIPTLEFCLAPANVGQALCKEIDQTKFPASVPKTDWWKLPQSPFDGTIRWIHPKGTDMSNGTGRTEMCTDYTGQETSADPTSEGTPGPRCPEGQVFQRVAKTNNLWAYASTWTAAKLKDPTGHGVGGSSVNARNGKTKTSGFQHEWVKFFGAAGIHAPN